MPWLRPYWSALCAGKKIQIPFRQHPATLGFQRIALAEYVGQVENWALSLQDGSRLHLWLLADGRWVMHRDPTDPARGPVHAALHLLTETRVGPVLLLGLAVVGVGSLIAVASRA